MLHVRNHDLDDGEYEIKIYSSSGSFIVFLPNFPLRTIKYFYETILRVLFPVVQSETLRVSQKIVKFWNDMQNDTCIKIQHFVFWVMC